MPTPNVSATTSPSAAPASAHAASGAKRAADFRERVEPPRARTDTANGRARRPAGALVAGPDGALTVVPAMLEAPRPAPVVSARGTPAIQGFSGHIDQLRWGAGRDETRLHVRLADGPYAGVEVRGVHSAGKLRIEVVADPQQRPIDLDALERALAARGIRSVDLSFADARDAPRRAPWPEAPSDDDVPPARARAPEAPTDVL